MSGSISCGKACGGIICMLIGAALVIVLAVMGLSDSLNNWHRLWIAGAAALGLLTGFSTGVSNEAGSGKELVTFVGASLFVPLLAGIGTLLKQDLNVTEEFTYSGSELIKKTTKNVSSSPDALSHPLAVLGSFFLSFALFAILGIIGGVLLRKSGIEVQTRKG